MDKDQIRRTDLDRHLAVEARVLGRVDDPYAAVAEFGEDRVRAEDGTRAEGHGARLEYSASRVAASALGARARSRLANPGHPRPSRALCSAFAPPVASSYGLTATAGCTLTVLHGTADRRPVSARRRPVSSERLRGAMYPRVKVGRGVLGES